MNKTLIAMACAAALAASMSAAYAGPCSPEITQVQEQIDASMQAKASGVTTLPESTAAKMHHQPTASSMAAAEVEAGQLSPEESTAVKQAIVRAREADAAGDRSACEQALADVRRLLGSPGSQTDDTRH